MKLGVTVMWAWSGVLVSAQSVMDLYRTPNHLQRQRQARKTRHSLSAGRSVMLARAGRPRLFSPKASFDNSANGTLKGPYFVRQILTLTDGNTSAITRAVSLAGTMTFDGAGNYTFSGQELDSTAGSSPVPYTASGVYALSSNGLVQIQSPIDNTDSEFGGVGGANQIVASATEGNYDDIFIAIPGGAGSAITGSYNVGFIDFLNGSADNVRDGYFTMTSNGSGSFGNVTVNGAMANQGNTNTTQSLSGVTYSYSGATGTLTFPTSSSPMSALVSGAKTFAVSADGNILVGGSAGGFDLFVGLNSATSVTSGPKV